MRTICYFLRIDEYLSTEDELRYDVLRQYILNGIAEDEVEYENCTAEQGVARLRQLYETKPPTFDWTGGASLTQHRPL